MELKEIIAWIESTIDELNSEVDFYKTYKDDVSAGFYSKELTKSKKNLELLKELQELRAQPKIIYCKDCKKRNFAGYCTVHQKNVHGLTAEFWQPEDDYFCADGERKTDGNNT